MSEKQEVRELMRFFVRVGHTTITVESHSVEEAIKKARQVLCQQLPRLWDVIQKLDENRFEVARAA